MNWGSWSNFFYMGGRGFYVWGSYLITLVCIVLEMWILSSQKRNVWQRLKQIAKLGKSNLSEQGDI